MQWRELSRHLITRDTVAVETNPELHHRCGIHLYFIHWRQLVPGPPFASAVFAPIVPAGLKMVAVGFFLLAAYVTFDAIKTLIVKEQPHPESHKLVLVWNVSGSVYIGMSRPSELQRCAPFWTVFERSRPEL